LPIPQTTIQPLALGALLSNTTGGPNTANGAFALFSNTTGPFNTAMGFEALFSNTAGDRNTAVGWGALSFNTTGASNTAVGVSALRLSAAASFNTAVGHDALVNNLSGNGNVALGYQAGDNIVTASNVICIGTEGPSGQGGEVSNSCFIGQIRGVTTHNADAVPVLIDSDGQLGTGSSSRRFKKDIKPLDRASEAVLSLKPVIFHYKTDNTNTAQFGLIAEEVAAVNPDLIVRDKNGEIYTVRYDAVNAMLLNEFLKEHRKVEEQQGTLQQIKQDLAEQRKRIETLTKGLQRVSVQVEASRSTPKVVLNNP
jgi:Chaperone of endosialidase